MNVHSVKLGEACTPVAEEPVLLPPKIDHDTATLIWNLSK